LPKDSVANVSQILTIDRSQLIEQAGRVSKAQLEDVLAGLDVVLGR
jgi:mRNA interferase MazF